MATPFPGLPPSPADVMLSPDLSGFGEGAPSARRGRRDNQGVTDARYVRPGWFTKHVFNRTVAGFTRLGLSVWGSRVLQVRGRSTGLVRETPVNLLTVAGTR